VADGGRERFHFIDQFRGLIVALMGLDHASGYFNSVWKSLNMFDPFFPTWGQFATRYSSYLCAPGFLILNGAVSWYSFARRTAGGTPVWKAKWHMIQRGLFLVLIQITWVNCAWVGFRRQYPLPWWAIIAIGLFVAFLALRMKRALWVRIVTAAALFAATPILTSNLPHFGIIACIGLSMVLMALIVDAPWWLRLVIGLAILGIHPALLKIPYDAKALGPRLIMQTFVDAGEWNKYPVLPWFALSVLGSVVGVGWLRAWKSPKQRIGWSAVVGLAGLAASTLVREFRGYGNLTIFDQFPHISFFMDTKYPPGLAHLLWFFGAVCLTVALIQALGLISRHIVGWLATYGTVALFFYGMHIAILSVVADRLGVHYRQENVPGTLVGWVLLLVVMFPLSRWFASVKAKNKNPVIQMI
jgi:uncharacterized membrane protein